MTFPRPVATAAFWIFSACSTRHTARPNPHESPNDRRVAVPTVSEASVGIESGPDGAVPPPCDPSAATTPLAYGACELGNALAAVATPFPAQVVLAEDPTARSALADPGATLPSAPESFVILLTGGAPLVVGSDEAGAMYGAFELAERLKLDGVAALGRTAPIVRSPATHLRAANLFLVLPAPGETSWWLLDLSFWRAYLDMMARARLNFLDLHGMYALDTTLFPNALLYFATSSTYPDVGVPAAERAKNLATLQAVVKMAATRGIRVGLMTYRSDSSPVADDSKQALVQDSDLQAYTREASRDLAVHVPGLWRLGFRIGESNKPTSWYKDTFVAGVSDADSGVSTYTRTWLSNKAGILNVLSAAPGASVVEAKFNGEHLGLPYAITGGDFVTPAPVAIAAAWWAPSYSYEDYLSPPAPYDFVWQVRAGGTHRIFRQASFARAKRTSTSYALAPVARGFTLEAAHAYFPQRDTYHDQSDMFSPWTFRRDELMYLLYGRLAYDPGTSERAFRAALSARVGTDALWQAVQAASDIVPWIQSAHTCGPDARNFAPELEWGGNVAYWALPPGAASLGSPEALHSCGTHAAFDSFAIALPQEVADDLVAGRPTTRLSPLEIAQTVLDDAALAKAAATVLLDPANAEARDVQRECLALSDLGAYFGHKLRAATVLAVYELSARMDYLDTARAETAAADAAWRNLAEDTKYILPFDDGLRMRVVLGFPPSQPTPFHWSAEVPWLAEDSMSIDAVAARVAAIPPGAPRPDLPVASAWMATRRTAGPGLSALRVEASPLGRHVTATLGSTSPALDVVRVLYKALESTAPWQSVVAASTGAGFDYAADVPANAAMFAVEVVAAMGAGGWRYPDVLVETPYRVVLP
jgi:hypothetical protein